MTAAHAGTPDEAAKDVDWGFWILELRFWILDF
jgi:hypothetical protein